MEAMPPALGFPVAVAALEVIRKTRLPESRSHQEHPFPPRRQAIATEPLGFYLKTRVASAVQVRVDSLAPVVVAAAAACPAPLRWSSMETLVSPAALATVRQQASCCNRLVVKVGPVDHPLALSHLEESSEVLAGIQDQLMRRTTDLLPPLAIMPLASIPNPLAVAAVALQLEFLFLPT
jgi:hypothetical protein